MRIMYRSMFLLGILITLFSCNNQESEFDKSKFDKVDSLFTKYNSQTPGCAIGIIHKGKLIYSKGYGMANIEEKIKNNPSKLFDIASTSKQFTAISILLLEEQNKLSLNDKIQKYLPELPQTYEPIRIKDLLTHTNGIRDHYALMALTGVEEISSEEENWANNHYNDSAVFEIIKNQTELNFQPNTYHQYCNSSFYLAGKIIERVSNISLGEFYKENLFEPLNMGNTFLYDDRTFYHENRTMGYSKTENEFKRNLIKYQTYGDGQIITNVNDLYLWDKNFYNNKLGNGNQDLIKKAYTKATLEDGSTVDYSIGGLEISEYKGLQVIDRMGGTQGISSDIVRFPEQEFTVICLANTNDLNPDPWRASLKIADIFLEQHYSRENSTINKTSTPKKIKLSKKHLEKFTGLYFNYRNKELRNINFKDSILRLGKLKLIPVDTNHFKVDTWIATTTYKVNKKGVYDLHWQSFTNPIEIFTKKEIAEYNSDELNDFKGLYFSKELNIKVDIQIKNNDIFITSSNGISSILKPLFQDTFRGNFNNIYVTIEFIRKSESKVTELRVSDDWLKKHEI